jgi:guanylate kinase
MRRDIEPTPDDSSGRIILFTGPHGVGEDTLSDLFIQAHLDSAVRHVRYTTRAKAPDELDGKTYHFLTGSQFEERLERDFFIDHVTNPSSFGGVGRDDLLRDITDNRLTCLTLNPEEGLSLQDKLTAMSLGAVEQYSYTSVLVPKQLCVTSPICILVFSLVVCYTGAEQVRGKVS